MTPLVLRHLRARDLRILSHVDFEPAERLNVITGDNGQGKTALLEAVYLVSTSRSFRTPRTGELVNHTASQAMVAGAFEEAAHTNSLGHALRREQTAVVQRRGGTLVTVDDSRPTSLSAYATQSPVVVFSASDLHLSAGPATPRRTLLDRLALFAAPSFAEHRSRYTHATKARQALLNQPPSPALDAYEDLCALHGSAMTVARTAALENLKALLQPIFRDIASPGLTLEASYVSAGSPDRAYARGELERRRARDRGRPSSSFGPHRDDIQLLLDGKPARVVASQGQHRAITISLKIAEAAAIAAVRGVFPILLLDDISSELDPARTHALFAYLETTGSQVFLTTTRNDLILTELPPDARRDFLIERGELKRLSG